MSGGDAERALLAVIKDFDRFRSHRTDDGGRLAALYGELNDVLAPEW